MNKLIYLKLEIKRNIKLIPFLLLASIALTLIVTLVGFCAGKYMNANKIDSKKNVYFSSEDSSKLTKLAVGTLSKTESITSLFNVKEIPIEEVEKVADDENTVVTVAVPKGFMHSLMTGDNYSINLYFSSTTSIYSMIITELSLAAQTALQAAQSAVYTLYDYYDVKDNSYNAEAANEDINMILVTKAFARDNMFIKEQVSSTGNYNIKDYYIASGIITILLLLGCIFILRSQNVHSIISKKLNQNGIGCIYQTFSRIFAIFVTLYILFSVTSLIIFIISLFNDFKFDIISSLIYGFALCLCAASITSFISVIMKSKSSSIFLLFISVISCEFISGAFLPSVFLPDNITALDKFLPTKYMLNLTRIILAGNVDNINLSNYFDKNFFMVIIYFAVFFVLTIIFTYIGINNLGITKRKAGAKVC